MSIPSDHALKLLQKRNVNMNYRPNTSKMSELNLILILYEIYNSAFVYGTVALGER